MSSSRMGMKLGRSSQKLAFTESSIPPTVYPTRLSSEKMSISQGAVSVQGPCSSASSMLLRNCSGALFTTYTNCR